MINKSTIKRTLQQSVGGAAFINKQQLKRAMGWGNDRTTTCLKGLDFMRSSRTKQYLIDDVAAAIVDAYAESAGR